MDFITRLFNSEGFMPHGLCLLWRPEIFWMHAISDSLVALSYYSIPLALISFVRRRKDLAFPWMFRMFGAFILACGTTHIMGVWTLWFPSYVVDGFVKLVTAVLSLGTAIVLWPLIPRALAMPSPAQLEDANRELRHEIAVRERAEGDVRKLNGELEARVRERTRELARRETLYRSVIETSLDAFYFLDEDARIFEWNAQAEATFGWTAEEAIGRNAIDLLFPEDQRAMYHRGLARFLATGETMTSQRRVTVTALRRDGTVFPAELISVPIRLDGAWTFSVFMRDVSDRERAEALLRQAQKMEAVGQMTGGLAHDFNNLLTVVIGCLDEMESAPESTQDTRDLIAQALGAAVRGAELTRQLLAFSRRQSLQPDRIDVNAIVERTTDLLRRSLGEQIRIDLQMDEGLRDAFADRAQVGSAVANLALNARDAMPKGGTLTIETANKHLDGQYASENADVAPGEYVMVAVSDSGEGIASELLPRVFEPFFTTKPEGQGSGLGLSMVYGFAKQSGGHVKIYSEVGLGTTVRLYLPRAMGESAPALKVEGAEDASRAWEGATILVVEDNAEVSKVVTRQVRSLGFQAILVHDAQAALEVLRSGQPLDLLFTDVVLPDLAGPDLANKAREIRPGLPVVFTSGFSEAFGQNGFSQLGPLLSKPYRTQELADTLRSVLNGGWR